MRRAGLRQCMDHDAVGGCGLSDEHKGWSRRAVVRRRDETASWRGRNGAVVAVAGSPSHAAALTTTFAGGGGAERRRSAGCRASPTASVRDHVPVVHGDAAKCAKMEACVCCCVCLTGERKGGNKLRDLTPESSSYEMASLVGWI
jgi:hypothetical protein